jgi:hypothetical protein
MTRSDLDPDGTIERTVEDLCDSGFMDDYWRDRAASDERGEGEE